MLSQYLPVLIQVLLAIGFAAGLLVITHICGPVRFSAVKLSPFECGVDILDTAHHRFSVKFYIVAMLFILFDIEAVFFYPWAIVFKDFISGGPFIVWEMATFVGILLVGYLYILKKGVLEWA